MKRLPLAFVLLFSQLAFSLSGFAAPAVKKKGAASKNAEPSSAPSSAATKPAAPIPPPAKPTVDVSSPWHTWSDPQGRTVEAAFCALQGSLCTVQSREGNIFQINLDLLCPAWLPDQRRVSQVRGRTPAHFRHVHGRLRLRQKGRWRR